MSSEDKYREGEKRLRLAGFRLIRQSGHRIWEHPDKRRIVLPSTPGRGRGWQNTEARLKRLGVPTLDALAQRARPAPQPTATIEEPTIYTGTTPQLGIVYRRNLIKNRGTHQISVSEVLSAAETLKGKDGGLGQREKWQALGKVLYLWLDQNTDYRELAIEFASTLEPDYETVFRGEFKCRAPMPDGQQGCGKILFTPASQGAHERRIHNYIHPRAEPMPLPDRPAVKTSSYVPRSKNRCGICKEVGHNARTCKRKTG